VTTAPTRSGRGRTRVRRDNRGRWFWFHPACSSAQAQLPTHSQALGSALEHSCDSHPVKYGTHIPIEPVDTGGASWLCPHCKQYCASDNPCDCCMDGWWDR
jgi:hypothetical protein